MPGKNYLFITGTIFIFGLLLFAVLFNKPKNDTSNLPGEKYYIDPSYINPESSEKSLRKANDGIRKYDLETLGNAIKLYISDNQTFGEKVTDTPKHISKKGADICTELVPKYIGCLPRDNRMRMEPDEPLNAKGFACDCGTDYMTGFFISMDSSNIILEAPLAEDAEIIRVLP